MKQLALSLTVLAGLAGTTTLLGLLAFRIVAAEPAQHGERALSAPPAISIAPLGGLSS